MTTENETTQQDLQAANETSCLRYSSPAFASMTKCPFSKSSNVRIDMLEPIIRSRKVLTAGRDDVPEFQNGAKVTFHFKTVALFEEKDGHTEKAEDGHQHEDTVVDDSKQSGNKPMEMFIGKQFKLPLWEEWLKHMRVGERSQIEFPWAHCGEVYPLLSKSYRNFCKTQLEVDYESEESRMKRTSNHCCGMQTKKGYGYADLDHLVEHPPAKLQFTLELVQVESPEQVDKEVWLMNEEEMNKEYPVLRKEGNELFARKQYEEAAYKYRKGLTIIEQLMNREKPNDSEWLAFDQQKVPFLLNLAQCELFLGEYYYALEHTNEVLKKDATNVKALFRRGKANAAVWNVQEARKDFAQVANLDSSLATLVHAELAELEEKVKQRDQKDQELLKGKLFA